MNWGYYNHALLPTTAPHEEADVAALDNPETWKPKGGGRPLFARWTSHFDCGYETEWWWCVLDKPFDISALKNKRRYVVKQGIQNLYITLCIFRKINYFFDGNCSGYFTCFTFRGLLIWTRNKQII
jgi:hypothetical protein